MLYITGDTHGNFEEFKNRMSGRHLTKDDILLITGDFGFDWDSKTRDRWIAAKRDYTVLFCDGNHENFDILKTLPETTMFGNTVGVFGNDTYRLLTGNMYEIEGLKCFVFGGAFSPDCSLRIPKVEWWPEEIPNYSQYEKAVRSLRENDYKFDLFISHTSKNAIKDRVGVPIPNIYDPVEKMIENLEDEIACHGGSWGSSWFGHFHKNLNFNDKYHCRYDGLSRIIDRERYETVPKTKPKTKTVPEL